MTINAAPLPWRLAGNLILDADGQVVATVQAAGQGTVLANAPLLLSMLNRLSRPSGAADDMEEARALLIGVEEGAALEAASAEADVDARRDLEEDDSEWADRLRGYGQPDDLRRNDAGEFLGLM